MRIVSARLTSPIQASSPTLKFWPVPLLLDATIGAVKTPVDLLKDKVASEPKLPESLNCNSPFKPAGSVTVAYGTD